MRNKKGISVKTKLTKLQEEEIDTIVHEDLYADIIGFIRHKGHQQVSKR